MKNQKKRIRNEKFIRKTKKKYFLVLAKSPEFNQKSLFLLRNLLEMKN